MPRPPSKHGLERKFKSWRKGKSKSSKSKGSLKQQLRGVQRLLAKLPQDTAADERRQELQERIRNLEAEIEQKQAIEAQRQHAKESHGIRFLERQRLTRAERSTRKLLDASSSSEDKERYEAELQRIALDQVYVAYFPHDIKYRPLFSNGVRKVDVKKNLVRRAKTRSRILKNLNSESKVTWISEDQYQRLPKEWTVEMEQSTFAAPAKGDTAETEINDNRFASLQQHAAVLEAAEQAESAARKEVKGLESNDDSSTSGRSSSDDDEVDPMAPGDKDKGNSKNTVQGDSSTSSSSDSDSSSEDEDETQLSQSNGHIAISGEEKDDSSESDSDDSDSSVEKENTSMHNESSKRELEDDFDDFLMPATEETNVFENAKQDAPNYDHSKSDKSQGWASQRQRPGQFKKPRVRK